MYVSVADETYKAVFPVEPEYIISWIVGFAGSVTLSIIQPCTGPTLNVVPDGVVIDNPLNSKTPVELLFAASILFS